MTVADERAMTAPGPNARIATSTDVDAVFDELIETIGAFARSRAPEIVGTAPEESTGLL